MSIDDQVAANMRMEAVDYVEGRLEMVNDLLNDMREGDFDIADAVKTLRQHLYGVRSIGTTFSLPILTAICHRFEDYLADAPDFGERTLADLQTFTDRIDEAVSSKLDASSDEIAAYVRALPTRQEFSLQDIEIRSVEIMLVMPPGLATKVMARELVECGYRIFNVTSCIQALQLVPTMRPDIVFVGNIMPDLSGVDLACAIKAMPKTRDIPIALITATPDDPSLVDLPAGVPILRKGNEFSDDVARALSMLDAH